MKKNKNTKICSTCKKTKDRNCFGVDKNSKDGLRYHCRECNNKYVKERRLLFGRVRSEED